MRLLQRYITLELFRVFAMVLVAISILLVFVGVFQQASENGLGPMEVLQILPYVVYSLLPITIPATMLLTVTVVYGRMAGDQELTAARAAGISMLSLLWPALLMGAFLSMSALLLTDQVIPWSINKIQETVLLKMEKIFLDQLRNDHQFIDGNSGLAIMVMDMSGKTLIKPTIRLSPKNGETYTIQAETATIQFNLEEQKALIRVTDCFIDMGKNRRTWISEEEYAFPLPMIDPKQKARHMAVNAISWELKRIEETHQQLQAKSIIARTMSLTSGEFSDFTMQGFKDLLQSDIEENQRKHRLRAEYHSRFALAGSCFFFVLLGSPISIIQAKRQFLTCFFMVFMPIIVLYYPISMLAMNQAKNGLMNPSWVMWVGNTLTAIVGLYFLRKVLQH
ncbi:MAG: LptF/LptG family permease [Planctomycetaceae bacterium]|nr:LptF/LptG family permease [Planctomycetaceae bacterium]